MIALEITEIEEHKLQMRCNSLSTLLRNFGYVVDPSDIGLKLTADSRMLLLANHALLHALEQKLLSDAIPE
jgi:hypothetical protein